jgi:exopolyphosphatase/guanosine-5'-triphosphate,3'-diphosphate pyrophosphatase
MEAVRSLALQLFDQLARRLKLDGNARSVLEVAGLLHDVGQLVSYPRHHKHSYELIMHADRLDLSTRDRQLVALVSRYHRKSGPRKKHPEFAALNDADRALVRALSGILRVADGLDRGHTAIVETATTDLDRNRLIVSAASRNSGADLSLECWGAQRKADVLAKVLDREVVIRPARRKSTGLTTQDLVTMVRPSPES